jgi:hypothetical protein
MRKLGGGRAVSVFRSISILDSWGNKQARFPWRESLVLIRVLEVLHRGGGLTRFCGGRRLGSASLEFTGRFHLSTSSPHSGHVYPPQSACDKFRGRRIWVFPLWQRGHEPGSSRLTPHRVLKIVPWTTRSIPTPIAARTIRSANIPLCSQATEGAASKLCLCLRGMASRLLKAYGLRDECGERLLSLIFR